MHGVSTRLHIRRSRSGPAWAMYDPVGRWTAQTSAEPQGLLTRGSDTMVTSGAYEPEALDEDSLDGKVDIDGWRRASAAGRAVHGSTPYRAG
jgi:hypothetical protein